MNPLKNLPRLEELESRDVPSYLAAEFPGQGVWRYESTAGTWQQMTAANASQVAADSAGDVAAQIPGQGVWLCQGNVWKQLTTNNASGLALGYSYEAQRIGPPIIHTYVVAEFPGQGLWRYAEISGLAVNSGWQQLTANNATTEGVDTNGHVVAEFPGWGVWYYTDGNGWRQLTPSDATSVGIASNLYGYSRVVAEFPGYGVWRFVDTGGWEQLTAANAATVSINQNGDVVGEFSGQGVWRYSDTATGTAPAGWSQVMDDADLVGIDAVGYVYGQFGNRGVWYDHVGSPYGWQQITGNNAATFGVGG